MAGFNIDNSEVLEKQLDTYQNILLEGIINGIYMCGGKVEGINEDYTDDEYHPIETN